MNKNAPVAAPKVTPDMLLTGIENQATKASHENALGASARFVERLIQAGQIKTMKDAVIALQEGLGLIQPELKKQLVAMQLKELESYLPTAKEEPATPAKA